MIAAAVEMGWLSWPQVAGELDGLRDELDGLTSDGARERFGGALRGLDDAVLLDALRAVDEEALEPCCSICGDAVVLDGHGWRHAGADAGHEVGKSAVWLPGPAAVPVEEVGVAPEATDYDSDGGNADIRADEVAVAGAALLGEVHDIDFHHWTDGWSDPFAGGTPAAAAEEILALADRLERAVQQARTALDTARRWWEAAERIARVRTAHRAAEVPAGTPEPDNH